MSKLSKLISCYGIYSSWRPGFTWPEGHDDHKLFRAYSLNRFLNSEERRLMNTSENKNRLIYRVGVDLVHSHPEHFVIAYIASVKWLTPPTRVDIIEPPHHIKKRMLILAEDFTFPKPHTLDLYLMEGE